MFLSQLSYQEKRMFLSLSVHVAMSNGRLSFEEKNLINRYCKESDMQAVIFLEVEPIEKVTEFFSDADDKVKSIVILEMMGLVYADAELDFEKYDFIKKFAGKMGMDKDLFEVIERAVVEYYTASMNLSRIIE